MTKLSERRRQDRQKTCVWNPRACCRDGIIESRLPLASFNFDRKVGKFPLQKPDKLNGDNLFYYQNPAWFFGDFTLFCFKLKQGR
jgi:hypothetical protein